MQDLESKIRLDVMDYLNTSEKMSHSDKVELLTLLIKKHIVTDRSEVLLGKKDLLEVISRAKGIFSELPMPVEMTDSEMPVHQTDYSNLCVIEATIGLLNKNDCLKKLPKFKYKKR